jgi:hypothetical protein
LNIQTNPDFRPANPDYRPAFDAAAPKTTAPRREHVLTLRERGYPAVKNTGLKTAKSARPG